MGLNCDIYFLKKILTFDIKTFLEEIRKYR